MILPRLIGFLAGMYGGLCIFLGCLEIYESWSGWSLDELKNIRLGVAIVLLGGGIIALPFLAVWAIRLFTGKPL